MAAKANVPADFASLGFKEVPKRLVPLIHHGLTVADWSGDNLFGNCQFCGADGKFYINPETGQWDCKKCKRVGNAVTYLNEVVETYRLVRSDKEGRKLLMKLAKLRGLPSKLLEAYGVGHDGSRYLIPVYKPNGHIQDIRTFKPGTKIRGTKGCTTGLLNADELAASDITEPVYLTAGAWDCIACTAMLADAGEGGIVVGVPGEAVFKSEWVELFTERDVTILYDADEDGYRGMAKVGGCEGWPIPTNANKPTPTLQDGMLRGVAKSIRYLNWPEDTERGTDLNDFYKSNKNGWELLEKWISDTHRYQAVETKKVRKLPRKRIPFSRLIREYESAIEMPDDFKDALRLIYSTIVSVEIEGDPLWLFLVGSPGAGKTLLLSTPRKSEHVIYRSTVSPASLVSGYNGQGSDPSLIPQLNGKAFVLKDFTEVLNLPGESRELVFSIFRGAYDGLVERSYGTGTIRKYESHFAMLAGVTQAIHSQATRETVLGERFLKFQLRNSPDGLDKQVLSAINGMLGDSFGSADLMKLSEGFIEQCLARIDNVKDDYGMFYLKSPSWLQRRLLALSKFVAKVRGAVERDIRGDVLYRPGNEVPTRLAKQLLKLGWALAIVEGKTAIDGSIWRLLVRVAEDSASGFAHDIVKLFLRSRKKELTTDEIAKGADVPLGVAHRQLDNMLLLKIVSREKKSKTNKNFPTRMKTVWSLNPDLRVLWKRANGRTVGKTKSKVQAKRGKASKKSKKTSRK